MRLYGKHLVQNEGEYGLFIDSGTMESANEEVIQKRVKLSGHRWILKGDQQVLNRIITLRNNEWCKVVSQIQMVA